jgi:hypothetical protein
MAAKDLASGLPEVHSALFLANHVPHLLSVSPADLRKWRWPARMIRLVGADSNKLPEPGTVFMKFHFLLNLQMSPIT